MNRQEFTEIIYFFNGHYLFVWVYKMNIVIMYDRVYLPDITEVLLLLIIILTRRIELLLLLLLLADHFNSF